MTAELVQVSLLVETVSDDGGSAGNESDYNENQDGEWKEIGVAQDTTFENDDNGLMRMF